MSYDVIDAAVQVAENRPRRTDRDQPPVASALDRLTKLTSALEVAAAELGERISPVLGPSRPEPAMGEVRADSDSSELAARLHSLADAAENTLHRLGSYSRRVEL